MKTVLIYDDEVEILRLYEKILRNTNYRIITKCNADEANNDLEKYKPDLVITDVVMEGTDGFEVINLIRHKKLPTKVMVVSGGGRALDSNYCISLAKGLQVDDTILKPVDIDEFELRISRLLS